MSWCDLTILTARSNVTIQTVDQINPHTLLCHSLYLVHRLFLSLSFNISLSLSLFCLFSLSHFIVFNFLSLSQSLPLPKFLPLSLWLSLFHCFFLSLSLSLDHSLSLFYMPLFQSFLASFNISEVTFKFLSDSFLPLLEVPIMYQIMFSLFLFLQQKKALAALVTQRNQFSIKMCSKSSMQNID